jgi:hypothetical protein
MSIRPLIDEKYTGDIWRMEIDELSDMLCLEIRHHADKKVYFSSIDLATGNTSVKDISIPERWLTGIEAAWDGVMLLHFYQSEKGPIHKGLMAVDGKTGKTLWSDYALSFDYLSEKGPIVYDARIQPRKLFLADIRTGATNRVYEPSVYKTQNNSVIYPELTEADELAHKLVNKHPFGNTVHYLEHNNFRIVSLHALKGGELIQLLEVFDETGLVYEDIINSGIQKMQPEAFILYKGYLIYIKNRSALKILPL